MASLTAPAPSPAVRPRTARLTGLVLAVLCIILAAVPAGAQAPPAGAPLRIAIVGLVHGHVRGHMNAMAKRTDVELVGVYEPDAALRAKFGETHGIAAPKLFADLDRLITTTRPEALVVYTNTFDHLAVIETAARHGVHVMVEKPLAVSTAHARAIAAAAQRGRIHVLVNYETTWYRSHRAIWRLMHEQKTGGRIRKIVAMDGHHGPKEIGTQPEFFDWLSDPVRNGAGALYDFGCYGANIATWLLDNQRPRRVVAVTQTNKPAIYARVDDEATIVLEYDGAQAVIEASWNWPDHRKDLEVYTESAAAWATGGNALRTKVRGQPIADAAVEDWPVDEQNALNYLSAVVRGRLVPSGPTSLENNVIVSEILDAARESAKTGKAVALK
ncbi:dehydrogenase [Luteitalea sp. TBR-22]|uniref:Gfo/Idh/MocA family protein n=1 Tax=Luteitalea sp. TBR-22 TaxID=2802971 RepID=UPI001AF5BDED|nr:Gfo/Idh/MocA family oxidoreductase [Luteitalea sp. TBR-22]BCS31852.1 dehydrogenase [Luteitalea sp. TBR-22]